MLPEVSAFRWVPPVVQGLVRDLRVRWALEEAGQAYKEVLVDLQNKGANDYRDWQPFLQVPAYRDGAVELFESGAIVLHIAERSETLMPRDEVGRARATSWALAALNSVEPWVMTYTEAFNTEESWRAARLPTAEKWLVLKLDGLAAWLDGKDYLEDRFTAGDLLMSNVLRQLATMAKGGALTRYPALEAYRDRCEARPAFARALEAQLATFRAHAP